MVYTAVTVFIFGFLEGVLSATLIYAVLCKFLDQPLIEKAQPESRRSVADNVDSAAAATANVAAAS